ncbi:MAG: DUF2325 domain-containing protein [Candidatus Alkanophagales archaeon]
MPEKSVIIVGGIGRLRRHYERAAAEFGFRAEVFEVHSARLESNVRNASGVIVFTDVNSKKLAETAVSIAKSAGVPVVLSRRSSVSALKKSLLKLVSGNRTA